MKGIENVEVIFAHMICDLKNIFIYLNMEIQEYTNQLKEYYESIMRYFSCKESKSSKEAKLFEDIFKCHDFSQEKEELKLILMMISKISENHNRSHDFIKKI